MLPPRGIIQTLSFYFRLPLRVEATPYTIRYVHSSVLPRTLLTFWLLQTAVFLCGTAVKSQSNGAPGKIAAMHVEGANVVPAEKVIAATGLKPGQVFDPQQLNTVMQKLGKSGVFADISYSYLPQGGVVKIDFKVEEAKFRSCHFDNFVWLSNNE